MFFGRIFSKVIQSQSHITFLLQTKSCIVFKIYLYRKSGIYNCLVNYFNCAEIIINCIINIFTQLSVRRQLLLLSLAEYYIQY